MRKISVRTKMLVPWYAGSWLRPLIKTWLCNITGLKPVGKRLFPANDLQEPLVVDWFHNFHLLLNRCRKINKGILGTVDPGYSENYQTLIYGCARHRLRVDSVQVRLGPRTVFFHFNHCGCHCLCYAIAFPSNSFKSSPILLGTYLGQR